MRCFLSINLPEELVSIIGELNQTIMNFDAVGGNFVKQENIHLTLKFLGEISEKQVHEIKKILEQIKFNEFEVSLKGLGAFPNENFIKVLWVGAEKGAGDVTQLQRELDEKLSRIGFQKEKSFVPHLTIARVKFVRDKAGLQNLFRKYREKEFGSFWCDKLHLMKSELTSTGVVYSEL